VALNAWAFARASRPETSFPGLTSDFERAVELVVDALKAGYQRKGQ
jgi:hypothetical protein